MLAGDFNMSLFCVVPKLRELGLVVNTAAWFPWIKESDGKVRLDSCGIFLVGGVSSVKCICSWNCFEEHHGHGVTLKEESDDDDAASVEELPAQPPRPTIQQFTNGQGFERTSYLPRTEAGSLKAIQETLTLSVEGFGVAAAGPEKRPLPPAKQKSCDSKIFDPNQLLFRTGVHMPLAVFLGKYSRRTKGAIERRSTLRKDRYSQKKSTPSSPTPNETNA